MHFEYGTRNFSSCVTLSQSDRIYVLLQIEASQNFSNHASARMRRRHTPRRACAEGIRLGAHAPKAYGSRFVCVYLYGALLVTKFNKILVSQQDRIAHARSIPYFKYCKRYAKIKSAISWGASPPRSPLLGSSV